VNNKNASENESGTEKAKDVKHYKAISRYKGQKKRNKIMKRIISQIEKSNNCRKKRKRGISTLVL